LFQKPIPIQRKLFWRENDEENKQKTDKRDK
jgi:hypothetical protein